MRLDNVSLGEIGAKENIGRELLSKGNFNKSGRIKYQAFFLRQNVPLSVNRLHWAHKGALRALGERNAAAGNRTFYGWAKLTVEKASGDGRTVVASPIPASNPFHAEIHLPARANDEFERRQIAVKVATASRFVKAE